ncbi:PepSY domain-containing protein [Paenibacillus tengchongensis]|uniref:PepSY domain-containing protein n=1 Tax=Paenibacillus tengchongensis TaxID=2608684 RepID=UPI00124D9505|nr:PepSY domain-containing protein [Paenibacillus tengchongensis]
MKKSRRFKNKYASLLMLAVLLIAAYAGYRLFAGKAAPGLTPEQAEAAVLQAYPGSVETLTLHSGQYVAELTTAQGRYELKLDRSSGEIVSIVLLESTATAVPAAEPTPQPSAPGTDTTASPTAGRLVSEEEAVELALQAVPGEADDVDTEIDGTGVFYLVEIKTADDREAVVQVDAISGSIMSVTWEDHEDDHS